MSAPKRVLGSETLLYGNPSNNITQHMLAPDNLGSHLSLALSPSQPLQSLKKPMHSFLSGPLYLPCLQACLPLLPPLRQASLLSIAAQTPAQPILWGPLVSWPVIQSLRHQLGSQALKRRKDAGKKLWQKAVAVTRTDSSDLL